MTPEQLAKDFEQYTFDYFLQNALNRVPDTIDTREGSIIYDALAPAAYNFAELAMEMRNVVLNSYVQTAVGEFLDYRGAERGMEREQATYSKVFASFVFSTNYPFSISVGDRFSSIGDGAMFYTVTKVTIANQTAELVAETSGEAGNEYTGQILPVTPQTGLETAMISEVLIPAQDSESDDDFRNRILSSGSVQRFGGNVADYISYIHDIPDIGAVQVYPVWDGPGTVKLVILNNLLAQPSLSLIGDVQELIDPTDEQGGGYGLAPIGHTVTIASPTLRTVNVAIEIDTSPDKSVADVTNAVTSAITTYFDELKSDWGTINAIGRGYSEMIYRSQIIARVLSVSGVTNVSSILLGGTNEDIELVFDNQISELPQLGVVTINA